MKPVEDALWRRADALLPMEGIESYTQGLMDLGATLCTRSSPDCARCPLQQRCVAFATGRTAELPVRKPKKAVPEKQAALMAVMHGGQVLLEQRPDSGIWGGLMSLPELDGHGALDGEAAVIEDVVRAAAAFGEVEETEALLPLVHVFTHYKLHIAPYRIALAQRAELDAPSVRVVGYGEDRQRAPAGAGEKAAGAAGDAEACSPNGSFPRMREPIPTCKHGPLGTGSRLRGNDACSELFQRKNPAVLADRVPVRHPRDVIGDLAHLLASPRPTLPGNPAAAAPAPP